MRGSTVGGGELVLFYSRVDGGKLSFNSLN